MGEGIDVSQLGYIGNSKPGCLSIKHRLLIQNGQASLLITAFHDFIGIATFEVDQGHWVEEQNRQTSELRNLEIPNW